MRASTSVLSFSVGAAALLISVAGSAVAQERAIEQCRQLEDETLRIACLEAALKEAYRETSSSKDESGETESRREAEAVPAAPSAQEQMRPGGDNRSPKSAAASNPFSPERASESNADAVVGDESDLGSEQVEARQSRRESETGDQARLAAGVSEITTVPFRRLQIALDNGMVWRQIEGDVQRLRVDEDDVGTVEIWETRLGGYKMKLNEIDRTIRVERIR